MVDGFDPRAFGRRLRALRRSRGLTQVALAKAAYLDKRTIGRIEQGQAPSADTLAALAAVFDMNVAQLLEETSSSASARDTIDAAVLESNELVTQTAAALAKAWCRVEFDLDEPSRLRLEALMCHHASSLGPLGLRMSSPLRAEFATQLVTAWRSALHQQLSPPSAPHTPLGLFWAQWGDTPAHADELEACLREALKRLHPSPESAIEVPPSRLDDPLGLPLCDALLAAFSDASNECDGREAACLRLPDEQARRQFERQLRLAWRETMASTAAAPVRRYLLDNETPLRAEQLRRLLTNDMLGWRHQPIFALAPELVGLAKMRLQDFYVEPKVVTSGRWPTVRSYIRAALESDPIIIVSAPFGHGKSLTAKMLAAELAAEFAEHDKPSADCWYPQYVALGRHASSAQDFDLDRLIRRANKDRAQALGYDAPLSDDAYAGHGLEQRMLLILDGLDEVHLDTQGIEGLFRNLLDEASSRRRFVVFTRPEMLPSPFSPMGTHHVRLQPFDPRQIAQWLAAWNASFRPDAPLRFEDLEARGLAQTATVPILLFLIAYCWDQYIAIRARTRQAFMNILRYA